MPLDATIQMFTGIVALAVALYARRGYQWVQESSLYRIFVAFLLLALAFIVSGVVMSFAQIQQMTFDQAVGSGALTQAGFALYYGLSIAAYGVLIYTYWRQLGLFAAAPIGPLVLFNSPPLELIVILLLGFIISAQILHEKGQGWRNQGVVTISFSLVLTSHILILFESGSNDYMPYFLARGLQMFGFALMVVFLYRLGRVS
ncbi:MAG: hypothetical protein ABR986_07420 [Methanomassiliicoccales archaeon]|jgi:hypothetical protein